MLFIITRNLHTCVQVTIITSVLDYPNYQQSILKLDKRLNLFRFNFLSLSTFLMRLGLIREEAIDV